MHQGPFLTIVLAVVLWVVIALLLYGFIVYF